MANGIERSFFYSVSETVFFLRSLRRISCFILHTLVLNWWSPPASPVFKVSTRVMIYEYYLTTWEVVHLGREITSFVSMAACQCLDAFPLTLVKMSGSVSLIIHHQQNTFKTSLCDLVSFMFIGLRYP